MPLPSLNSDVLGHVASFLPLRSLRSFSLSCKDLSFAVRPAALEAALREALAGEHPLAKQLAGCSKGVARAAYSGLEVARSSLLSVEPPSSWTDPYRELSEYAFMWANPEMEWTPNWEDARRERHEPAQLLDFEAFDAVLEDGAFKLPSPGGWGGGAHVLVMEKATGRTACLCNGAPTRSMIMTTDATSSSC
ncbi:hypothetical protein TeGR_g2446, partial [Tetraparma gracilis]